MIDCGDGILRPQAKAVIGNGVAFDPVRACSEIDGMEKRGIQTKIASSSATAPTSPCPITR